MITQDKFMLRVSNGLRPVITYVHAKMDPQATTSVVQCGYSMPIISLHVSKFGLGKGGKFLKYKYT